MVAGLRLSVELSPTTLLRREGHLLPALLPHGTRVFLPALPADPPDAISQALGLLRREGRGLVPVPHVAATRVASLDALERRLDAWQGAWGGALREVLVVRGDAVGHSTSGEALTGAARGAFGCSLDLLQTNALQRGGFERVWMCGHPEGVAGVSAADARSALREKLSWADAEGVAAGVATQFCFDSATTLGWVDALRDEGSDCDVSLGVAGPASSELLRRMADRCEVAPPPSPAANAPPATTDADAWPWPYTRELARWQAARGAERGVQAFHLYPFGGLRPSLRWLRAASRDGATAGLGIDRLGWPPQQAEDVL